MQESNSYKEAELFRLKKTTYSVINALLSLAFFHYAAWCLYSLYKFFFV